MTDAIRTSAWTAVLMTALVLVFLMVVSGCSMGGESRARVTVTGSVRVLEGTLHLRGSCVRVDGQGLAWSRYVHGQVQDGVFRFQNGNGQVLIFHDGDQVKVWGLCKLAGPHGVQICLTPTLQEAEATPSCQKGPYFLVNQMQPIHTPTPPLSSP